MSRDDTEKDDRKYPKCDISNPKFVLVNWVQRINQKLHAFREGKYDAYHIAHGDQLKPDALDYTDGTIADAVKEQNKTDIKDWLEAEARGYQFLATCMSNEANEQIRECPIGNLNAMVVRLNAGFNRQTPTGKKNCKLELRSLVQTNKMSIVNYISNIRAKYNTYHAVYGETLDFTEIKDIVYDGLNKKFWTPLILDRIDRTNYQDLEAMELALVEEEERINVSGKSNGSAHVAAVDDDLKIKGKKKGKLFPKGRARGGKPESRVCFNCQERGHIAANCALKKIDDKKKYSAKGGSAKLATSSGGGGKIVVCYWCFSEGHNKSQCPLKEPLSRDRDHFRERNVLF
jgi:hypothetical protein